MEIIVREEGTPMVFALEGRLDTNTSHQLEDFANNLFNEGKNQMIVDMAACDYVSSAGLRVIVAMQKRAVNGGSLVFRNVLPEVQDVFDMTGFSKILTIE